MNKLISPLFNDALLEKCGGVVWRLIDGARHIKSAASDAFSEAMIRKHLPDADHFGVHQIVMGSGEFYGFNKNGDFWDEPGLVKRCHTFVTHAHMFREHNNTDPKFKIGDVKAAAFNFPMHRVELIAWGHKKKAEAEYERAKSGKGLTFSMAARVPYDVCSCCEKQAKSSKHYCVHAKYAMTQWLPQFSKFAFVRNPEPTFFDDSAVQNPADVIAHFLSYRFPAADEMQKAASADPVEWPFFSDVLAKAAGISEDDMTKGASDHTLLAMLRTFAEEERFINGVKAASTQREAFVKLALQHRHPGISEANLKSLRQMEPDVLWFELTKRGCVLPFLDFAAYVTNQTKAATKADVDFKQASALLPTIYTDLLDAPADAALEAQVTPSSMFKAATSISPTDPVQQLMDRVEPELSVQPHAVHIRIEQGQIMPEQDEEQPCAAPKFATATPRAKGLAQMYALHKAACAVTMNQLHGSNFVDSKLKLLLLLTR